MRKPKSTLSAWIVEQRKARDWKSDELARRLDVSESTVRSWESGRGVSPDNLERMERLFGLKAPGSSEDQGDLASAIRDQADAIREQADAIRQQTDAINALVLGLFGVREETPEEHAQVMAEMDDFLRKARRKHREERQQQASASGTAPLADRPSESEPREDNPSPAHTGTE